MKPSPNLSTFGVYVDMRPPQSPSPASARAEIRPGVWLDSRLALWLAEERLLIVADLHWGYAATHRARGNLLPLWGDDELERRLRALLADYSPVAMLWLGDIVHAAPGGAAAERFLRDAPLPVTLLAGNHDRRWSAATTRTLRHGRYVFHHGDQPLAEPLTPECVEICGHHHPAVNCGDDAGTRLKLPALVASASRVILPAFSPWAAGTPWNDRLSSADTLWVISPQRVFALPRTVRPRASAA